MIDLDSKDTEMNAVPVKIGAKYMMENNIKILTLFPLTCDL